MATSDAFLTGESREMENPRGLSGTWFAANGKTVGWEDCRVRTSLRNSIEPAEFALDSSIGRIRPGFFGNDYPKNASHVA